MQKQNNNNNNNEIDQLIERSTEVLKEAIFLKSWKLCEKTHQYICDSINLVERLYYENDNLQPEEFEKMIIQNKENYSSLDFERLENYSIEIHKKLLGLIQGLYDGFKNQYEF